MIKDRRQDNGKSKILHQEPDRRRGNEELANFTRKDKAEQFLNGLFREYRKTDNFYPHWVRQGYFKTEFACLGLNRTTEYWIEKY